MQRFHIYFIWILTKNMTLWLHCQTQPLESVGLVKFIEVGIEPMREAQHYITLAFSVNMSIFFIYTISECWNCIQNPKTELVRIELGHR